MTTQSSTPAGDPPKKKGNCFLWGCLTVIILLFVSVCCLGSLILLPMFTDFDPLGLDFRNRIEQYIPWQEFLEDPSAIPGMPDILDESFDSLLEEVPADPGYDSPATGAAAVPLSTYIASDFPAIFDYPTGWEIEIEEYSVTFYDPYSYNYLYVGEYLIDEGMSASQVAQLVADSLQENSQEGTFNVIESTPFFVPDGDDAYLMTYEWTDVEGYYIWALDLETVSGNSNVFFFLSGEDIEEYQLYRDLIDIIAASFTR